MKFIKLFIFMMLLTSLSGCGGRINNMLGLDRRGPDEFTIVSHPEPVVPSDTSTLPEPK